ncbi:hypothetical protein ERJ75_000158300 [Trypanosoma vivax]|nr:hypothetical protein ERJ75_000158300 [Trypanosoma vivax]
MDMLEKLKSFPVKAAIVCVALERIEEAASHANASEVDAQRASIDAKLSSESVIKAFADISNANNCFTEKFKYETPLMYGVSSEKMESIRVDETYHFLEKYNASKILSDHAETLVASTNLTTWREKMISLIDSTHETLMNDVSACHFTFTTDNNEKVKSVKQAIK